MPAPQLAEVQPLAGNNQLRRHLGQRIVGNRQTKPGGQLGGNPLTDQTPPSSVPPLDVISMTVIPPADEGPGDALSGAAHDLLDDDAGFAHGSGGFQRSVDQGVGQRGLTLSGGDEIGFQAVAEDH